MRFYGSAMPMPHIQGAFRQSLVAEQWQCHRVAEDVSINEAAFAEPLAVTLHAVNRAGSLLGKRVLVTGCGPIGALAIIAARAHGAREIVATDVMDAVLEKARAVGADRTINVASEPEALSAYAANKGTFDVQFEASGNESAVRSGLEVLEAALRARSARARRRRVDPAEPGGGEGDRDEGARSASTRSSRSRSTSSTRGGWISSL